jgi:phage terminase large subunit GpA-like protein
MKGVQICATTGVLENAIGYFIAHVKSASMMMVTADSDLAKLRMESAITPMLQESGLLHLIKSNDEASNRKSGKTDKRLDCIGGGCLIPNGAQNPNKFRSLPIRVMLRDEIDGWPDVVGKDGDPMKLTEDRTAAYESERKILDISTPLIKGQSKIEKQFLLGDQRYYYVNCISCGHSQVLRWRHVSADGVISGIWWEEDEKTGELVSGSVRYLCESCGHPHTNDDKTRLLASGQWHPTATPSSPDHRSYHLSALYSPVGMQTWEALVRKWKEAWDTLRDRVKDHDKLQVFYNNVLGESYEVRGDRVRYDAVSAHKRSEFHFGQVPNKFAERYCGSKVLVLTCTVDVQKADLAVAVVGWCRDGRAILVDYWRFEGNSEQLDDKGTWVRLRELLWKKVYVADDGTKYRIKITLVDSGYLPDQVYRFCESFPGGVFPSKGKEAPQAAGYKPLSEFKTNSDMVGFLIIVDYYKDRWSAQLKREWDPSAGLQPAGHFNAPLDVTEEQLRELTVETKRPRATTATGRDNGYAWHRPAGVPNELWDLLVYASAALELLAMNFSQQARCEFTNWPLFYKTCAEKKLFMG